MLKGRHQVMRQVTLRRPWPRFTRGAVTLVGKGILVSTNDHRPIYRTELGCDWSRGAIIAQACHASCAAIVRYLEREDTKYYTAAENIGSMTKVVLKASNDEFRSLHQTLRDSSIEMHCWTEQPEGIETCIALRPYDKDRVHIFFSRLNLLR